MATPVDDLFLRMELIFAVPTGQKKGAWYKEPALMKGVVTALSALPLFAEFALAGLEDELTPFKKVAEAVALMASGTDDAVVLQNSADDIPDVMARFSPSDGRLVMKFWVGREALRRHQDTVIDQLVRAAVGTRKALKAGVAEGYAYPIHHDDESFEYPRPRPPRSHPAIRIHSVIDFIDLTFHDSGHDRATPDEAKKLADSKPEAPAQRKLVDGMVVVTWARSAEEDELRRAAAARETWFASLLETEVEGDYNEQGDAPEDRGRAVTKPPLTLYAPRSKTGYKAVMVFPDGSIEQHAWNQAKMVLKDGELKDGTVVKQVKIVVPLRELAFTIKDEAVKAGFAGVLYPDDDGAFWDPDPPGSWATPPIGADTARQSKPRARKGKVKE